MNAAIQVFGRVDVLVNNAGTSYQIGPGEEIGCVRENVSHSSVMY